MKERRRERLDSSGSRVTLSSAGSGSTGPTHFSKPTLLPPSLLWCIHAPNYSVLQRTHHWNVVRNALYYH